MPRTKNARGPCPDQPDAEFMSVWIDYPNGNGRKPAWRAWWRARPTFTMEQIREALAWQRLTDQWQRGFVPMFATYINQERWTDTPPRRMVEVTIGRPRAEMGPAPRAEIAPERVRAALADPRLRAMIDTEVEATIAPYRARVTATEFSAMREKARDTIARRFAERFHPEPPAPLRLVADI